MLCLRFLPQSIKYSILTLFQHPSTMNINAIILVNFHPRFERETLWVNRGKQLVIPLHESITPHCPETAEILNPFNRFGILGGYFDVWIEVRLQLEMPNF